MCGGGVGKEEKLELVGTLWQNVVNIVIGNLHSSPSPLKSNSQLKGSDMKILMFPKIDLF